MPDGVLAHLPPLSRAKGWHLHDGYNVMEAVCFVAGEPSSKTPDCASRALSFFLLDWNNQMLDEERDELLRPLVPRLVRSAGTQRLERRRVGLAVDWLLRESVPTWLRLIGRFDEADSLAACPVITDWADMQLTPIWAAREAVRPARALRTKIAAEASEQVGRAACSAVLGILEWPLAEGFVDDKLALKAIHDAVSCARFAAAIAITVGTDTEPTVTTLQQSALRLVDRMLEAKETQP